MQLAVLLHSVHAFYSIQTSRSVLTYSAGRLFFVNNQIVPSCNNLGSNRQERRDIHQLRRISLNVGLNDLGK